MNKPIKIFLLLVTLFITAYFLYITAVPKKKTLRVHQRDASWSLLFQQNQLENEGKHYEELLQFELAKEKFRQAIEIGRRMTPRQDYWGPTAMYVRVLQKEGRYEEAFEYMSQLCQTAPKNEYFSDRKKELEALVEAQKSNSDFPVRQYIEAFKEKYTAGLPPKGAGDVIRITTVLRLYDLIADYDAGIAYIDELMKLLKIEKEKRNEDATIYDRIITFKQAEECSGLNKKPKFRNPEWRACKLIRDHLRVREGFEQDKAEGRKNCISVKPREICMGRATKALIESDYFPW